MDQRLEITETHAILRLAGPMTFQQALADIRAATAHCYDQKIRQLMVHALEIEGFDPPGVADRYRLFTEVANVAHGAVRLAIVVRAEFIDPSGFGVTVAANRGLIGRPFTNENEALAWLLG